MKKIFAVMLTCILVCFCMTGCVDIPTDAPNSSAVSQEDTTTTTAATAAKNTVEAMVWIPQSGKKYHSNASCSNMNNPIQVSKSEAISLGYGPCKRCYK